MSYRQLTQEQRYQIGACLRIGMKQSEIAKEIEVHKSTVSREIRRGRERTVEIQCEPGLSSGPREASGQEKVPDRL